MRQFRCFDAILACGEAHPANYRGCKIVKEIQTFKNNKQEQT